MSEQLKPCPFCGHSELVDDTENGVILCDFCQSDTAKGWWNRRTPGLATRAMLERAKERVRNFEEDGDLDRQNNCNPWIAMLLAFIAEWEGDAAS